MMPSMTQRTIGVDLGDKHSNFCELDETGAVLEEGRFPTTAAGVKRRFEHLPPTRIALETGTHSPWVARLLLACGHEVLVANPRKLRLIYQNDKKSDRVDAESLARLARVDPHLLAPIHRRSLETPQRGYIDRLHDVTRKKQFHRPVHENTRLSFQAGQPGQIKGAPHDPCDQTRKRHRLLSCKR